MRTMNAFVVCLLSVSSLANAWAGAAVQNARAALDECSAYPQAGMRECLTKKVSASGAALKQSEDEVRNALAKWDEDAKSVKLAVAKLHASVKEFAKYREAHCAFESSLGGGAIGSALEIRRLSCVLELNLRRSEQLGRVAASLPAK